jgi:hypothetical protein
MIGRIQSNRSAAKARRKASQELAGAGATNDQITNHNANGVLALAPSSPPRPAVSADLLDLLNLVTPDNAAAIILAAIGVLGKEARTHTGHALAYGLSYDDF